MQAYETALKRLQAAKCQCIEFVNAVEFNLSEQNNFEIKKQLVNTRKL